ncbi:MAG: hypothetical protein RBU23_12915 [Candidatus Auribacterota bacterium]|jgi:succinate dehydrogenase/fumarate reductase flavoprotein subunit|nr:hypothetical protein [Candidatus Auribacterota bacterium]
MSEQDNIDLQNYSQKELLRMTYEKVKELSSDMKEIKVTQVSHSVRISVIEVRVMMWGALFGVVGAAILQAIISFFK